MKTFLKRVECWFRESHAWELHWEDTQPYKEIPAQRLVGSECLRCGKYRAA